MWQRCYWRLPQPYIVGMMLGYSLHRLRGQERLQLAAPAVVATWAAAIAVGLAVIYGNCGYQAQMGEGASNPERALYNGLHRLAWAVALSWVILACSKVRHK